MAERSNKIVVSKTLIELPHSADPPMGSASVKALPVIADQDRSFLAFADRSVDGAGGARHEWDECRLVSLAQDSKRPVSSLEAEVLDVRRTGLAHPKPIQAEQGAECSVGVVEALGGEQERPELSAIHPVALARVDRRTPHVLSWVGGHPTVDVGEAVEAADRGKPAVDGRGRKPTLFQCGAVELNMRSRGLEDPKIRRSISLAQRKKVSRSCR
jgi:hypothetical protein